MRPTYVAAAVAMLVLDALLGVAYALFSASDPSHKMLWFWTWTLLLLQGLIALQVWRGKDWFRYLLAACTIYVLAENIFTTSFGEVLPSAVEEWLRAVSFLLYATSTLLLFLPKSSDWFKTRRIASDA